MWLTDGLAVRIAFSSRPDQAGLKCERSCAGERKAGSVARSRGPPATLAARRGRSPSLGRLFRTAGEAAAPSLHAAAVLANIHVSQPADPPGCQCRSGMIHRGGQREPGRARAAGPEPPGRAASGLWGLETFEKLENFPRFSPPIRDRRAALGMESTWQRPPHREQTERGAETPPWLLVRRPFSPPSL